MAKDPLSALPTGDVDVPVVGNVPKVALVGVVVAVLGYVGWRYYQARQSAAADTTNTTDASTSDFADGGTTPDVLGAVNGDGTITNAGGDTGDTTQTTGFTSNGAWTQAATTYLEQTDTWSFSDIATALGNYLASKPLSTLQQTIVQAAIAAEGQPPVGSFSLIPGGNTAVTVAPTGLKATPTADSVSLTFSAVPGAAYYRAYRTGVSGNVGSGNGTTIVVGGLNPNTTYSFHVAAVSSSGALGPNSASVSAKTKGVTIGKPNKPTVSAIASTSAHAATKAVSGATGYNWYVNGVAHGHSDAPSYTITGLKSKTTYHVSVSGDNASQAPGAQSTTTTFKTK